MKPILFKLLRIFLVLIPVAAALAVAGYLVTHRPGPAKKQTPEAIHTLRVIPAPVVDLVPRAYGYGQAEPVQVWEAVAQVKGRVIATHPELKPGQLIKKGALLVHIDPVEYELAVARLKALIDQARANLSELDTEAANLRQLIDIEQRSLALAEKMLARRQQAAASRAVSREDVDREEKNFLAAKKTLQQLKNSLTLIPSRRNALHAALNLHQADLAQAQIDLENTRIHAPFDCRLADVAIEPDQFVGTGQGLFKAHGIGAARIHARFRMESMRRLLGGQARKRFGPDMDPDTFQKVFSAISATVSLADADWPVQWEARIERLRESVDPGTREILVTVVVEGPYEAAVPGKRPPLMPGMFCRVDLSAPARPGQVVLPRSAVHDQAVFLVDSDNRLEKKPVEAAFAFQDMVVIAKGLSGGETVVVSDPAFAITGMKIEPVMDDDLAARIKQQAQNKGMGP
jgi:RND family efflux transporter MFP subunit